MPLHNSKGQQITNEHGDKVQTPEYFTAQCGALRAHFGTGFETNEGTYWGEASEANVRAIEAAGVEIRPSGEPHGDEISLDEIDWEALDRANDQIGRDDRGRFATDSNPNR